MTKVAIFVKLRFYDKYALFYERKMWYWEICHLTTELAFRKFLKKIAFMQEKCAILVQNSQFYVKSCEFWVQEKAANQRIEFGLRLWDPSPPPQHHHHHQSPSKHVSTAITKVFSASSPHFDPTIKVLQADSGLITEDTVPPQESTAKVKIKMKKSCCALTDQRICYLTLSFWN